MPVWLTHTAFYETKRNLAKIICYERHYYLSLRVRSGTRILRTLVDWVGVQGVRCKGALAKHARDCRFNLVSSSNSVRRLFFSDSLFNYLEVVCHGDIRDQPSSAGRYALAPPLAE